MNSMTGMTDALKLFNEKAKILANSVFVKQIREYNKILLEIDTKMGKDTKTSVPVPDREAINSFVLTFRFFIQNNEICSFGNLGDVYRNLPVSDEMKKQFHQARQMLNDYLDSETSIKIKTGFKNGELTRRKVFDVFLYGDLAHANPKKKKLFDEWMGDTLLVGFLWFEFVVILFEILNIIKFVENLNAKVIKSLM